MGVLRPADLCVGLGFREFDLEVEELGGRILLELCGRFLLAGQLPVHFLSRHTGNMSGHTARYINRLH